MRILSTSDTNVGDFVTSYFIKIHLLSDDLQELARKEILDLIERLLLEADLDSELPKLEVYGKNLDGIKDFLKHLLIDQNTGRSKDFLSCKLFSTRLDFRKSPKEASCIPIRL